MSLALLEDEVTEYLNDGWSTAGGISFTESTIFRQFRLSGNLYLKMTTKTIGRVFTAWATMTDRRFDAVVRLRWSLVKYHSFSFNFITPIVKPTDGSPIGGEVVAGPFLSLKMVAELAHLAYSITMNIALETNDSPQGDECRLQTMADEK